MIAAALVSLTFAGVLASGERFYFRDLSQNHGPIFAGARQLLAEGQAPWWNPWVSGGQPFVANPNSLLLHPAGMFALLLPGGAGLDASILLSSLLGAAFIALLLRDAGRTAWAAASGALVYALSGPMLSIGSLPNLMAAWSWVPPALFFIRRARAKSVWLPAAVMASAMVLVPCEPASVAALVAFAILPLGVDRRVGPARAPRWRKEIAATCAILAGGALAAAYQIVPAILWTNASVRGLGLTAAESLKWSLAAVRLPEIIVPGLFGDPALFDAWWGGGLFETGFPLMLSLYVGVPAVLLAAIGTWAELGAVEGPRTIRATATALAVPLAGIAFMFLATGWVLPMLLAIAPVEGLFRYPEKFVLGAVMAVAFQAALGVDRLLALQPGARGGSLVALRLGPTLRMRGDLWFLLTAGAIALALQAASFSVGPERVERWFGLAPQAEALRSAAARGVPVSLGFGAAATGIFAGAVLLLPFLLPKVRGGVVFASVVVSLFAGALVLGPGPLPWRVRANPSWPAEAFRAPPFFARNLAGLREEGGRFFRSDRPANFAVRTRSGSIADGFIWDRRSLSRSSASEFGVELAYDRSTDLMNPRGAAMALRFMDGRSTAEKARLWDLAGVRLVLAYDDLDAPGLAMVDRLLGESTPPMTLYENRKALPLARIVGRARVVESDDRALSEIVEGGDDWSREVRLVVPPGSDDPTIPRGEPLPPAGWGASSADGARGVTVVARSAGRLRMKVDASPSSEQDGRSSDAPGGRYLSWLVVAENDVPGWSATLDGAPAKIRRAEGMLMSIAIPDGRAHEVDLRYVPPGLFAGLAISAAALGASVLIAVGGLARRSAGAARR